MKTLNQFHLDLFSEARDGDTVVAAHLLPPKGETVGLGTLFTLADGIDGFLTVNRDLISIWNGVTAEEAFNRKFNQNKLSLAEKIRKPHVEVYAYRREIRDCMVGLASPLVFTDASSGRKQAIRTYWKYSLAVTSLDSLLRRINERGGRLTVGDCNELCRSSGGNLANILYRVLEEALRTVPLDSLRSVETEIGRKVMEQFNRAYAEELGLRIVSFQPGGITPVNDGWKEL